MGEGEQVTIEEQVCPRCHGKGKIPSQCVCWDNGEWNVEVPPVCNKYVQTDELEKICIRCDHDEACHGK